MPKLWLLIENMDKMGRFGSGGGSTCWGSSKKWVFHPQVKWCLPFYSFKMLVCNPQTLLLAWVWRRSPFIWILEQWNLESTEGEETLLSCWFYLEEVLHSSPLPLDLCHGPRSPQIITASQSSFSKGLEFSSSSVSLIPSKLLAVSVFPRHIPGYTAERFLEMLLRVTEHVAWLVWSGCDFPDPSCPRVIFFVFFFFSSALPDALSNTYFLMMSIKLLWVAEISQF